MRLFRGNANERGDTIVEVMIVLSVLALTFSIAYATANAALNRSRNAQEHAEALQYIKSEIELIRANPVQDTDFCLSLTDGQKYKPATTDVRCVADLDTQYRIRVDWEQDQVGSAEPNNFYVVTVTWPGTGGLGQQQERLRYKYHP